MNVANSLTPHSASRRVAFYPWAVVAMLFPVALLNYVDRMMLATMRTSIRADIPSIANDADFGFIMALFLWVYAFLSPVGGYLADRFSRRWMVIISLFLWSLMTWFTGHAHTFSQMAWSRALMGMSEACYIPAALALIADFHPGPTRSRAIGIHMCGVYVGQALGGVGGYIADTSSWRNAFYWFGAAGVFYAIFLLFSLRDARAPQADIQSPREHISMKESVKTLLGTGAFLILVVYFTLPGMAGWAIKSWLPTVLASTFNLKQGPAGLSATGYVTCACFFGVLLGGALADRAVRYTPRGRIYVSAFGMGLCVPALIGLGNLGSLNTAIACMILFGLGFGFFDANNMPILCQIAKPQYRATGYGLMNLIGVAAGAGITGFMGVLRDHNTSLGVVFSICAAAVFLSGLLILLVRPHPDEIPSAA